MKLISKDHVTLKKLLHLSTKWGERSGMSWSTGKCCILVDPKILSPTITIAADNIRTLARTQYLGFTITNRKVLAESSTERIKKAHFKLHLLKNIGDIRGSNEVQEATAHIQIVHTFHSYLRNSFDTTEHHDK